MPLSSTTLKKTNYKLCNLIRRFNIEDVTDTAEFVYFGIARNLQRIVNVALHKIKILKFQFNMDGVPIFKSSNLEFWPILGKIFSYDSFNYKPFVVAIHSGVSKPKSLERYLSDFVEELNNLLKHGIVIHGQTFAVEVMCFVCDRPARSFIKCIKGHGGYHACERCDVKGELYENRIIYSTGEKRSNKSFRNQKDPEHHSNLISPLSRIQPPLNMVNHFVLDSMHLAYLGVMKKLLVEYWLGAPALRESMLRLSQRLVNLSCQVPCEFQCSTRSLAEVSKWKATEYRFSLLYCGPIVLKDLLPLNVYNHFLLFCVSFRILSSETLSHQFFTQADSYLTKFVNLIEGIYGKESLILNVHSLKHVVEDFIFWDAP